MKINHYVTCEYCNTTQKPRDILQCLGCGGPLTDNGPRFPGLSDLMRDQHAYVTSTAVLTSDFTPGVGG